MDFSNDDLHLASEGEGRWPEKFGLLMNLLPIIATFLVQSCEKKEDPSYRDFLPFVNVPYSCFFIESTFIAEHCMSTKIYIGWAANCKRFAESGIFVV